MTIEEIKAAIEKLSETERAELKAWLQDWCANDKAKKEYAGEGTSRLSPTAKAELLALIDEIAALPLESPDDGFSGEDHDDVLYPRQP